MNTENICMKIGCGKPGKDRGIIAGVHLVYCDSHKSIFDYLYKRINEEAKQWKV